MIIRIRKINQVLTFSNVLQLFLPIIVGFTVGFFLNYKIRPLNQSNDRYIPIGLLLHNKTEMFHKIEDTSIADTLFENVRVLCWVLTYPQNLKTKAIAIMETWGKRCNLIIFMSTAIGEKYNISTWLYRNFSVVNIPVAHGRSALHRKTRLSLKYIYDNYLDQVDWFFKADDDTYAIIENLRYMLWFEDPTKPVYFGHKFRFSDLVYMSGGAGYVMSRAALKVFVEKGIPNFTICPEEESEWEDLYLGKCLREIGVEARHGRDKYDRALFFAFPPEVHLNKGASKSSDMAITYHYVPPVQMYELEYLVYHLRPYGVSVYFGELFDFIETNNEDKSSVIATKHLNNSSA